MRKNFEGHKSHLNCLRSSKSCDTTKIRSERILTFCSSLRISSHLPAPIANGGGEKFLILKNFQLSSSGDLDPNLEWGYMTYRVLLCISHWPLRTPNFTRIGRTFADGSVRPSAKVLPIRV